MKTIFEKCSAMVLALSLFGGIESQSNELLVYPAKGQSNAQMTQDKATCADWAKKQLGYDPETLLQQQNAANTQTDQKSEGVRPRKRHRVEKQKTQAEQATNEQTNQKLAKFHDAQATCLQGKGYTVNH